MKELIIFDLDGTLNASKMPPDEEMADLLCKLLAKTKVAVISGASFVQFEKQLLKNLGCSSNELSRLFLMPTSGGSLYRYEQNSWVQKYKNSFSKKDIDKIRQAFELAITDTNIASPDTIYGELIEDRDSQVTYSPLGQEAPIELKEKWDPDHNKAHRIVSALVYYIPEFEVRIGGGTSIDVTKKGIDKAYGIQKIREGLKINQENMLFIGDATFPEGNDYSVKEAGIETIQVSGPEETKKIIHELLKTGVPESKTPKG
ncbi:HAD-IIB family hydrolase [Patescibacteria group bacterium]|nr:HAD-IIB family hydrolase [Patescibacteria group bacterium]MBU2219191.1 HAD-IIB family hydrolase [Patescibacteria group bacterium]MBU2263274.1 HAD-IIB family hydrolase [Patescibacteria group bacterium]